VSTDHDRRVETAKQLLAMFAPERMLYLGATVLALLILMGSALYQVKATGSVVAVAGMFGAGSVVAFTTNQLLRMWRDIVTYVCQQKEEA
jgi:hypothetical protein